MTSDMRQHVDGSAGTARRRRDSWSPATEILARQVPRLWAFVEGPHGGERELTEEQREFLDRFSAGLKEAMSKIAIEGGKRTDLEPTPNSAVSKFVGVDGCKAGWFSVGLDSAGGYAARVHESFADVLTCHESAKIILVDVPIGLPEGPGGRDCDREARLVLGKRRSSVFPTPTRQTVGQATVPTADYATALEIERFTANVGISKQTFYISPKIAEVDSALSERGSGARPPVREVHPEICFWALNGGQAMKHSKTTKSGYAERLALLQQFESRSERIVAETKKQHLRKCVALDDILDALAAAVTAREAALGAGLASLPANPPQDPRGLPMEMVYYHPTDPKKTSA